ncbi:c-type cytochrome [Oceanithermus desulfurans]|uniref:Cytochrome c n=1 Tax=Oceanithermus profundus TaxID=187137 RepID=A0A7C5WRL9_9DEIN|nr:cytochrome c [Oceanithermus profundus]
MTRNRVLVIALVAGLGLGLAWASDAGKTAYDTYCAACHQVTGEGVKGVFTPLAGEVYEYIEKGEEGRKFLIHVVLFGLQGKITAMGVTYDGFMPPLAQISDAEIAAILNYTLTAWGNAEHLPKDFKPYTAEEVAKERGLKLTPQQVYLEWKALVEEKE